MMSEIKTGIHDNIQNEIYHRGDGWSDILGSTGLKKLQLSPAHFKVPNGEPTKAMNFGSAFHSLLLEPEKHEVICTPEINRRTKAGKEEYAKFLEESEGKIVVTPEENDELMMMLIQVRKNETASMLLKQGKAESSIVWQDATYGFLCKCRPDYLRDDRIIIDVKTSSQPATPEAFSRACVNYGYHISAAWYQAGVLAVTGKRHNFVFIVCETKPPYAVSVFEPDREFLDAGRKAIQPLLEVYDRCLKSGQWPGYDDRVQGLSLPAWAVS
jgi:hypothetical protein